MYLSADYFEFNIDEYRQKSKSSDIIYNVDGSKMYAVFTDDTQVDKEEIMSKDSSYSHELLHALKISWPFLLLIIAAIFGFFQLTQSRIDASRAALEAQITEIRTQMSADRNSASSDNSALRSDVNQGLNRVADKLDDIGKTLTSIKVDQASQQAQLKQQ